MPAEKLSDLLKTGDRVAVSNITGREASTVSVNSQRYCGNIVGGWALAKGGQTLEVPGRDPIPVFSSVEDLVRGLPEEQWPNKMVVYSPPKAVYGEIKDIVVHDSINIETIYVVTEHVSIEVTAKINSLCSQAGIDVVGCNSLGMINTHDGVRVGAVGGDDPAESFVPGSVCVISNSGNMVNTMSSYLLSAGLGTSYGISTGKDTLILTPLKRLLELAMADEKTKMIVLYVEPGGLYEKEAVEYLQTLDAAKPVLAYVTGEILQSSDLSLGHAGAVVEGPETTASAKMKMFDEYFNVDAFDPDANYAKRKGGLAKTARGIRITSLHHLPAAAALVRRAAKMERDFAPKKPFVLAPWFVDFGEHARELPRELLLERHAIPKPYSSQLQTLASVGFGSNPPRRDMRNASHASSNDGAVTRIYGRSVENEMQKGSFVGSMMLAWLGHNPQPFEIALLEKCLIASLSNGPGTISAQGAKLSTSAGNSPNTAMIGTLACIGDVHGGNGRRGVEFLIQTFKEHGLEDPYDANSNLDVDAIAREEAEKFARRRAAAKEAGTDYARIPCLGHPVFRNQPVNYDPREKVLTEYMDANGLYNIFIDFYHRLVAHVKELGVSRNVWAVNLDGAIAATVLAACWKPLKEKRVSVKRVTDMGFMLFAVGRVAGAAGEYLDHQDHGSPMDMRIPVSECVSLTRAKD